MIGRYQAVKTSSISLAIMGLVALTAALPASAGLGGLWGYLNSSDYILKCAQVRNRSYDFFYAGYVSTHKPLGISFCNMGAYTIDHVKLKIWRKEFGNWGLIYDDKISSNFNLDKGVYWSGNALKGNEEYKFKIIYKIAGGEKKACTKIASNLKNGILWQAYSTGTTYDWNRCRTIKTET